MFGGQHNSTGFRWQRVSNVRSVPPGAVVGGNDVNGDPIYVGMGVFRGLRLPAKVIPNKGKAYVPYGGKEHEVTTVEVLCAKQLRWVWASNGSVPPGAIDGGKSESGERLYIGRANHLNSLTVGKVHPSHCTCYISFSGEEHSHSTYEVLTFT